MAASVCRCQSTIASKSVVPIISFSGVERAPTSVAFGKETPAATISTQNDDRSSDRSAGWKIKATAAAACLTLISATPTVLAAEVDLSSNLVTHSIPGDNSLSIAIPIPDQGTWIFAMNGFLAPPPRASVRDFAVLRTQGGCPSWRPVQFEMIVPDGVHPKSHPRQGAQWPAIFIVEGESDTILDNLLEVGDPTILEVSDSQFLETNDPNVKYSSILDALLRMADGRLTCFRL